jgi:integrase/recombinase XerD
MIRLAIDHAIKIVAGKLEKKKNITCYTDRHSWATQMMRHGAPVSFIGKQLGHMNSSSTDNYLNSFEDETIKQWQKKLTEF